MIHFFSFLPWRCVAAAALLLSLHACSTPQAPGCPTDLNAEALYGVWVVELPPQQETWTLTLGPHPEHRGSLRDELVQGPQRHPVVADLDDGAFTMEESHDGQRIAATWLGQVQVDSCGQRISGQRSAGTTEPAAQGFEMRSERRR